MMLGAYSSRIVRSMGCAALTLLLAATTCPTLGAPTARDVESLSAAQLSRLPDGTLIKLKTGRTVSLGILRSEHKLWLQRFADAAALGKQAQTSAPNSHGGGVSKLPAGGERLKGAGGVKNGGTLVPMDFSLTHFNATFAKDELSLGGDFLAFCKAAAATACLYFPSGVSLSFNPYFGVATHSDDYFGIGNPSETPQLCNSLGGKGGPLGFGCVWNYPLTYSLGFNSTAQGYDVTQSANCPSPFVYVVDPHTGLVAVSINTKNLGAVPGVVQGWDGSYFLPSLQSCVVSVFLKK